MSPPVKALARTGPAARAPNSASRLEVVERRRGELERLVRVLAQQSDADRGCGTLPWTPGGPAGGSAFELAVGAVAGGEPVCCTGWAPCVVVGGEVELAAVAWLGVELVPVVAPWVVVAGVVTAGLAAGAGIEHGVGPMRIAMASSALAACVAATTCEAKADEPVVLLSWWPSWRSPGLAPCPVPAAADEQVSGPNLAGSVVASVAVDQQAEVVQEEVAEGPEHPPSPPASA
eukprot:s4528_g3.t1